MLEKMKTRLKNSRGKRDKELGVSLVEVLVYIALFTILSGIVLAIINVTISSSQRITSSSATQAKINQSASLMQREISLANSITWAGPERLDMTLRQGGVDQKVSYFTYQPGQTALPPGVTTTKLPTYNAVIRATYTPKGTTPTSVDVVLPGYDPAGYTKSTFGYFNKANSEIVVNGTTGTTEDIRASVSRIEFRLAATSEGRNTALQVESSAVPLFSSPSLVASDNNVPHTAECVANFKTSIKALDRFVTLTWNAPAGATSYTITRYNVSNGNTIEGTTVIPDPATTSISNSGVTAGLQWGLTYRFAISVSSAGGILPDCAAGNSTVVPDKPQFVNINSLATDLGTLKPQASLTMMLPTDGGEQAKQVTTKNLKDGYQYTVARGLINQLAWDSKTGATSYTVYANGGTTPIATITNGTVVFQDTASTGRVNYGKTNTYIVSASNSGGEGYRSDPITLVSPPGAPTMRQTNGANPGSDPVRPDGTVTLNGKQYVPTSTTTVNRLIMDAPGTNADAYRVYGYRGNTGAVTNCSAVTYQKELNFTTAGSVDAETPWGSYDCYAVAGVNDAGIGAFSSDVPVQQYPGKFTLNGSVSSSQYNFLDLTRPNWGDGKCWTDPYGYASSGLTCSGRGGSSIGYAGDPFPNGLFDKVADQYTDIYVAWNRSLNATGGYDVTRVINGNGVQCGSAPKNNLSGCPYPGTAFANFHYTNDNAVTAKMRYEMPGADYSYTVAAKSASGASRPMTGNRILTNPDIPSRGETFYEHMGTQRRITLTVLASVRLGNSTAIQITSGRTNGSKAALTYINSEIQNQTIATIKDNNNNTTFLCNGGGQNWGIGCSSPYDLKNTNWGATNFNGRSYQTKWTVDGSTVASRQIWKGGAMAHADPDGYTQWTRYPDRWPGYWTGAHAGWWSGYASHSPVVEYIAGALVPPDAPLAGTDEAVKEECSARLETDPGYSTECVYGYGIPDVPANVTATVTGYDPATKSTSYLVTWSANAGAVSYKTLTGATVGSVTDTKVAVDVPAGKTLPFQVAVVNNNNTGAYSPIVNLESKALAGTLTATLGTTTSTSIPVSWNKITGADGYDIYRGINGATPVKVATVAATSTSGKITWDKSLGENHSIYVVARNNFTTLKSNTVTAVGDTPSVTITSVTVDPATSDVTVKWNGLTDPTATYTMEVSTAGSSWSPLTAYERNVTATGGVFSGTVFKGQANMTVRAKATTGSGTVIYSAPASFLVPN